jgi:hypothetical protein
MPKLHEEWGNTLVIFEQEEAPIKYICYASDLRDRLKLKDEELEIAVERAFKACRSLNISVSKNFKSVFRPYNDQLVTDWKLSSLACYLIVINANPEIPAVARVQILFAAKNFNHVNFF